MHRPPLTRVLGATLAIAALAACQSGTSGSAARPERTSTSTIRSTTTTRPADDGRLVIGQLAPLTGPIATIAPAFTTPVQLAVDEMNLLGGVNGGPVGLVVADDGTDLPTARTAFARLADTDRADAVIGPSSSEIAADLMPTLPDRQVVMCSGSNAAGVLSEIDAGGYYFRTVPGDKLQAAALAARIRRDGHRRTVVMTPATEPPTYREPLLRALRAEGRRVRAVTFRAADAPAVVERVLEPRPDAIVVLGDPEAAAPALRALAAAGAGPAPGGIATYGSVALAAADRGSRGDPATPGAVGGIRGMTPAGVPAGIDHPLTGRMLAAGVDPFFSAAAYDCTLLVGLAAIAADSDAAADIARALPDLLTGERDCTGFAECAELVREGRSIHYRGAFSDFDRWQRFEPGSGAFDEFLAGPEGRVGVLGPDRQIRV